MAGFPGITTDIVIRPSVRRAELVARLLPLELEGGENAPLTIDA
ncbi:MAG TPA: hypothetical protein VLW53_02310 [Candidatus Eisenbacteria bacterium]|nr:hypothetical protein [Candidatus Eisenbacteria bacterium]